MSLDVFFEVITLRVRLATLLALVGLFTRMGSDVSTHVVGMRQNDTTVRAGTTTSL